MGVFKFAFGANYKRFWNNLKLIAEKEKKCAPIMFCDAALSALVFGSGLTDYLNYEFYKKSYAERAEYATVRTQDDFYERVCPAQYKTIFTVKPKFHKTFAKYINRGYFDPAEMDLASLESFLASNEYFMEKPIDGLGGHGVKKVASADITDASAYLSYLTENRLFIEDYVIQHPALAALCDKSVNTIRVMTSVSSGKPEVILAVLRVGNGSASIDNFHGGGMAVMVDLENGRLVGNAVDKNVVEYSAHPVTNITFDGYQLPFWDKVVSTVCEAALVEPRITVVGWDVAITADGPVFIEGNRRPGFDLAQVVSRRGRKDLIRKVSTELKERNKKIK